MSARVLAYLVAAAIVGVLAGSGLAGLAERPANDPCLDYRGFPENSTSGGSLELWPFGLRCRYRHGNTGQLRTEFFGPTTTELYAWIAVATLLAAIALLRRGSAFARGAFAEMLVLASLGATWQFGGAQFAFMVVVLLATPLAFVVEHRLRLAGTRAWNSSLQLGLALAAVGFCALYGVIALPVPAIAVGVVAAGFISRRLARPDRTSMFAT